MLDQPGGRPFAIKQILQLQMQEAIDLYIVTLKLAPGSTASGINVTPLVISMYRKENYTRLLYRCAIALKLASIFSINAMALAANLADFWRQVFQESKLQVEMDFTIRVVPPGLIDFHLTDRGTAAWLQYLISLPAEFYSSVVSREEGESNCAPQHRSSSKNFPQNLFSVQYAHARCCSLLRLGHQEGAIALSNDTTAQTGQVVTPMPIPWLDGEGRLHSTHRAETQLIAQILEMLDELGSSAQPDEVKLARAMENFHRRVRIFDEVKIQKPQLAQARLGLVAIARLLLRSLLENRLGVCAPEEL